MSTEHTVQIPLDVAMLIDQCFVPVNPNKMRTAHRTVVSAVRVFKAAVSAAHATAPRGRAMGKRLAGESAPLSGDSEALSGESGPYTSAQVSLLLRCAKAAIAHERYRRHGDFEDAVELGSDVWTDDDVAEEHDHFLLAMDDLEGVLRDLADAGLISCVPVGEAMSNGQPIPRVTAADAAGEEG